MPKADKRERQRQNRDVRRAEMLAAQKRHKQRRTARNLAFLLLPVVLIFVVLQVTAGSDNSSASIKRHYAQPPGKVINTGDDYTATIDTSNGEIQVALDTGGSLKGVNNFVFLSKRNFYNGLRFVRVAKDFAIQAGSPNNTTTGGPGYTDVATAPTKVEGQPTYPVGTVAMANSNGEPAGTFGSQFFIVTGNANPGLAPDYTIIGKVTNGLDVAQKIGLLYPANSQNDGAPTKKVTIRKITITSKPSTTTTSTTPPGTPAIAPTTTTTVAP